jgi:ribosome maturation factor RimP
LEYARKNEKNAQKIWSIQKKAVPLQRELIEGTPKGVPSRVKLMDKQQLQNWIEEYLQGTDYELITLNVSAGNDILVEVDRLAGVDVDFCAELNRFLVEKLDAVEPDYSLEVGSVSLTDPFKTKMQYEKNLGHDVEVLVDGKKIRGQLVSVDEETFSVDIEEKTKVKSEKGKVKSVTQIVTKTSSYDAPKYVKYDLNF